MEFYALDGAAPAERAACEALFAGHTVLVVRVRHHRRSFNVDIGHLTAATIERTRVISRCYFSRPCRSPTSGS